MRMAPEGCVVNVHLAICCGPAARARKHPSPTQKGRLFKCQGPGLVSPGRFLGTSQTLSFRRPRWDFQKTSPTGAMTPCSAFVGVQRGTARVEAAAAWLTHRPKIITLPYLGPSPRAAPLRSKQGAHYQPAHWRPVHTA
ncbi:hypothetical protein VZT92_026755 [Zoarces viviparus]|uniref:Uncharacterized protein n=1 Tax=Zoarces viviparus TaxID=48416 RepID=A0AAW1DRE5_ZOAVI